VNDRAPKSYKTVFSDTELSEALSSAIQQAGDAMLTLASVTDPQLAIRFARLVRAVAAEASKTQRFAHALSMALEEPLTRKAEATGGSSGRGANRRDPSAIDPFAVFADGGEGLLRHRLAALDLEQLRDIVAAHGMDYDRLAMKWKDPDRVRTRIVQRVTARAAKGSAFRGQV